MPLHEHNIAASFKAICENTTAALFVINAAQQCIYANPAAETLTGFKASELVGQRLHDLIHHSRPDGSPYPVAECPLDNGLPGDTREQGEDVFVHADGSFYPVSYTTSPIAEDGSWLRINDKLCNIVGYSREELLKMTFQDITHPDDLDGNLELYEKLRNGEIEGYNLEKRYYRRDGALIWVRLTTSSQKNASGEMEFCIAVIEDITSEKEHQQHLNIMAGELQHRVKNTLATVQAIARMSLPEDTPGKEAFVSRILALSRSHDLLLADNWSGAAIADIVEQAIHPFGGTEGGRIMVSGPDCKLSSRTSLALSMALNELGTNAVKYGALSGDRGMINIRWDFPSATEKTRLEFSWQETGGPEVSPPQRRGFGTTLIERALASEMQGETAVKYLPSGVIFRCSFPVE